MIYTSNIEIMKLEIIDDCYYVIFKTFWIRLIQRTSKRIWNMDKLIKNIHVKFELFLIQNFFIPFTQKHLYSGTV